MDFFARQDVARRNTGRLVVLFALATASIVASVYLVVVIALGSSTGEVVVWHPLMFLAVVVCTVTVIGLGSLYKIIALRGGGSVVAESLGGKLIPQDATDPVQRKVLNVVEEMAIASGMPVPPVYLMDNEKGINAFAAGYTPADAVIGVTRGCVEQLSRDELQGVIGHEFSHILNGDMRLNIRLIGILNGILIIGIIGHYVLRSTFYGRRSRGKGDGGALAVLAIGAGLALVGFLGTLFGNMIKAAVSRQREFLADASAVQFTRDPGAFAGALKKIGALGAKVRNPGAVELSHMFFAQAITSGLNSMFSTHPGLEERIRRIEPGWDGTYPKARELRPQAPEKKAPSALDVGQIVTGAAILATAGAGSAARRDDRLESDPLRGIGRPTADHVAYAAALVRRIPMPLAEAAREPYGARAVIYAMLAKGDRSVFDENDSVPPDVADLTRALIEPMKALDERARLPLVDLAMPALRELSPSQYRTFRANVTRLVEADQEIEPLEWMLQRMILRHLDPQFSKLPPSRIQYYSLNRLTGPCELLLSALSHVGHDAPAAVEAAFEHGRARLDLPGLRLLEREQCGPARIDRALDELDTVSFKLKRDLLEAGAACIRWDKQVTVLEAELLRGVADALGCPMPPFLPGQPLP